MRTVAITFGLMLLAVGVARGQDDPAEEKPDDFQPDPSWKNLSDDLWFDAKTRTVILRGRVCLRSGYLEHLVCLDRTKEHESILATRAVPRMIHAALILAVGEPGHPVRYRPKFEPAAGPKVFIEVEYEDGDQTKKIDARSWVIEEKTKKPLEETWVFAGSDLFYDPDSKRTLYAADGGDLVTVANFPQAILDLPIISSNSDAERLFVADADKIPPRGTRVTIYLRGEKDAEKAPGGAAEDKAKEKSE